MTDLQIILVMPFAVLAGHGLGFGFIFLVSRLDAASRARQPSRVAPPAASRGDHPSLP
ncbi:hypothetical protein ACFHWW_27225 [Ensifer sp. P24N7]|uniref:hypothetical protein n=1 Tax=Sinorhizobium sp. P24N7 TaxID=3348358 RepID=UPI0035F4E073